MLVFGSQTLSSVGNRNFTFNSTNIYTWDVRNRLIAIAGPGHAASFQYDPLGKFYEVPGVAYMQARPDTSMQDYFCKP